MDNSLARMPSPLFKDAFLFREEAGAPLPVLRSRRIDDPVGMWYAARARHGIDDRMWFGLYEGDALRPQWHTCSHRYSDGLGALPLLLAEKGYGRLAPPRGRGDRMPDWRTVWRARKAVPPARPRLEWKVFDPSLRACPSHAPVSVLLSAEQSCRIDEAAAAAGVSTTVWLLWTADRALRRTLASADSVAGWVYPVNLRGSVQAVDAFANQCSGLVLAIERDMDALACKRQISERFAHHEHWRQWFLLNLGRWLGQWGLNLLYRLAQAAPGRFAGSYSNLGEWRVPGLTGITCAAPGSPAYPVSVGTVLCNGRRALACRLHPVIGGNAERAIEFVKVWRELSLGEAWVPRPAEPEVTA